MLQLHFVNRQSSFSLLLFCLLSANFLFAQPGSNKVTIDPASIDVATIRFAGRISNKALFFVDPTNNIEGTDIKSIPFTDTIPAGLAHRIPGKLIKKNIYLKFTLTNTSDSSINLFYLPGFYFEEITIYKAGIENGHPFFRHLEDVIPNQVNMIGYRKITVAPHEKSVVYTKNRFIKNSANSLGPMLIQDAFLPYFVRNLQNPSSNINLISFVFTGILLMMILYSIAVFSQTGSREFFFYAGYAFLIALLFFLKSYLFKTTSRFNYFFESWLDFMIQATGNYFYFLFIRKFIQSKKNWPMLDKILFAGQVIIIVSTTLFSFFNFATNNFIIQEWVENITKYLWIISTIIFIAYAIKINDTMINYLAVGHFFLIVCGFLSLFLIISTTRFSSEPGSIWNNSLFYYEIGLTVELIFFLVGLAYKNKKDIIERVKERERLKLDNERKEFEKQVAILEAKQDERNRISADMHDELGSGVTAIRLMSEIVKAKMKEQTLPEIEKISNSANELLNKMNTIIWTMVSSNDSAESLVAYIRAYAVEFFETTPIECHFSMPSSIPPRDMSGEKRRNIFLSVKEALNNVLKHSQASNVSIDITVQDKLIIVIADDGIGINMEKLRKFGNGLQNMKKRIESIEGKFSIENHRGTRTVFELML